MAKCGIDAEYRGEERYSKLSIAFGTQEEEKIKESERDRDKQRETK